VAYAQVIVSMFGETTHEREERPTTARQVAITVAFGLRADTEPSSPIDAFDPLRHFAAVN
jgi:hypothetical protein